jgi:hypothetical protein
MAHGRSSWLIRAVGLALARRMLRRALSGSSASPYAVLATVVSGTPRLG